MHSAPERAGLKRTARNCSNLVCVRSKGVNVKRSQMVISKVTQAFVFLWALLVFPDYRYPRNASMFGVYFFFISSPSLLLLLLSLSLCQPVCLSDNARARALLFVFVFIFLLLFLYCSATSTKTQIAYSNSHQAHE